MNAYGKKNLVNPIENIVFPTVIPGTYKITVDLFETKGSSSSNFTVVVLRADARSQVFTGTVTSTDRKQKFTYTV